MSFLTPLLLTLSAAIVAAAASTKEEKPTNKSNPDPVIRTNNEDQVPGCNANVCFALDGSGSITEEQFQEQVAVTSITIAIIGATPVEIATVQYGTTASTITTLTPIGIDALLDVQEAEQLGSEPTFLAAGINVCFSQLFRRSGEANVIVLFTDGNTDVGADPVARADLFRNFGGKVFTVAIGNTVNNAELLAIAGNDPSNVFEIDESLGLLVSIERVINRICG